MPDLRDMWTQQQRKSPWSTAVVAAVNMDGTVDLTVRGATVAGLNVVNMYQAPVVGDVVLLLAMQPGSMIVVDKIHPST
jgi:hypothetical protein